MAEIITGSRKRARAKVILSPGSGSIKINSRDPLKYFGRQDLVDLVHLPLKTAGVTGSVDIKVKSAGLLKRDPREKERMKYGLAKRRKRFQFSKR
jgi:small subunit ribosomal protein S9